VDFLNLAYHNRGVSEQLNSPLGDTTNAAQRRSRDWHW